MNRLISRLTRFVPFNNEKIEYMGRVAKTKTTTEIYWSGSSIKIAFKGTSISAILQDECGKNYFSVLVDDAVTGVIKPLTSQKTYLLASGLPYGVHTVQLFKRTEWTQGKTSFYGFNLNHDAKILSLPPKEKHIEFYGDSITCGYAVEDDSGMDSDDPFYTDNYKSYAAITARYFDADYTCIARSGIGISIGFIPQIMPEMYNLHNPSEPNSIWNYSQKTMDMVIINLLQNDYSIYSNPEHEEYKRRFGNGIPDKRFFVSAYGNFVKAIRTNYPNTQIICMLGNMDITKAGSLWPEYVQEAVSSLNDIKIHTLIVPFKNTSGHPNADEQRKLATTLIRFLKKIDW